MYGKRTGVGFDVAGWSQMEITPKNKFKFRRNTKLLVGNLSKIKLNNVFMTVFFFLYML